MGPGGSPVSARDLAGLLREVHRRSTSLPAEERRRAVKLCLAYHLRGQGTEAALAAVAAVREELGAPVPGRRAGALSLSEERALGAIVNGLLGQEGAGGAAAARALPRAEEELARAAERLAATGPLLPASAPWGERVGELQERLARVERALERTAQEFLDRLLEAFDPEAAKAYVGEKGIKLSSFYKASVYDALCEKFSQLRAHHEKGRLVRDFRASFKRSLRQGDPQARGE